MANIYNRQWATEKEGKRRRGEEKGGEGGGPKELGSDLIEMFLSLQKMPSSNLRPIDLSCPSNYTLVAKAEFKGSNADDTLFV